MEIPEFNQGFEITGSEIYRTRPDDGTNERIVIAEKKTRFGMQYVTWESLEHPDGTFEYFWGRYFDDEGQAAADYHRRLAERYYPSDEG